jgi:hypothetical protein
MQVKAANVRIDSVPVNGSLLLNGVAVVAGQVVSAADMCSRQFELAPALNGSRLRLRSALTSRCKDSAGAFDVAQTPSFNVTLSQ